MKKIIVLVFIILFFLCGCSFDETISRSGTESIVSAIGIDQKDNEISVTLETIITNNENNESKTRLLIGLGDTIQTAFADTLKYATEPLTLSHLGVAVMGKSIDSENFKSICDWFYNKQDTTLSTFFISAYNAEELLSQKAISSIAVGYDLVGLLEQQEKESGTDFQNRFYKIQSLILENTDSFRLPHFICKDDKFYLGGVTVYKNFQPIFFDPLTEQSNS